MPARVTVKTHSFVTEKQYFSIILNNEAILKVFPVACPAYDMAIHTYKHKINVQKHHFEFSLYHKYVYYLDIKASGC